jgi:hypothetical protein
MSIVSSYAPPVRASRGSHGASQILQRWRRQIAGRIELAERRGVRPFALVGYRIHGTEPGPLVPLERLSFIALFDERDDDDRLLTRLIGVRGHFDSGKLTVGGPELTLFDKDVRSPPGAGRGGQLDAGDAELCELALGWEQHLERVNRHVHYPRRSALRWPTWWCDVGKVPAGVTARTCSGLALVPLDTALAHRLTVRRVFADVTGLAKRQVVAGDVPHRLLLGTSGRLSFNLVHTRFRRAT